MKSLIPNPTPQPLSGNSTARQQAVDLERDARKALELCTGRTFGDWEWMQMKGKLIEFYAILRGWEEETPEQRARKKLKAS